MPGSPAAWIRRTASGSRSAGSAERSASARMVGERAPVDLVGVADVVVATGGAVAEAARAPAPAGRLDPEDPALLGLDGRPLLRRQRRRDRRTAAASRPASSRRLSCSTSRLHLARVLDRVSRRHGYRRSTGRSRRTAPASRRRPAAARPAGPSRTARRGATSASHGCWRSALQVGDAEQRLAADAAGVGQLPHRMRAAARRDRTAGSSARVASPKPAGLRGDSSGPAALAGQPQNGNGPPETRCVQRRGDLETVVGVVVAVAHARRDFLPDRPPVGVRRRAACARSRRDSRRRSRSRPASTRSRATRSLSRSASSAIASRRVRRIDQPQRR